MGASNKPTIEGFVDRLLEENHIKPNETITVENTLKKATNGMTAEEKAIVIRDLNEKLDATSSDLITPQGLNFASLEKTVEAVTTVIIKEKQNKIEEDAKKVAMEEALAREKEAKIQENMKSLDDIFKDVLNLGDFQLPEEKKREIAEEMENVGNALRNAKDDKEFKAVVEDSKKSPEKNVAMHANIAKVIEEIKRNHHIEDNEVAFEILKNSNSVEARLVEELGYSKFENFKNSFAKSLLQIQEKIVQTTEKSVRIERSGKNVSFGKLIKKVEAREGAKKWQKIIRDTIDKGKKLSTKENILLFEDIANEYIKTGRTISEIYEQYKKEGKIDKLDFEDVLGGVENNLKKDNSFIPRDYDVSALIKHERACRILDLTMGEYIVAKNITMDEIYSINNDDLEILIDSKKALYNDRNKFEKTREILFKRRNFSEKDRRYLPKIGESQTIVEGEKEKNPYEKSVQDRKNVLDDTKQIYRIKDELGISLEEATKKYFEEKPEALEHYSEEEQKVLLGKDNSKKKEGKIGSVFRKIIKNRNQSEIDVLTSEIARLTILMTKYENNPLLIKEVDEMKRRLEEKNTKLKKRIQQNERIDRKRNKKNLSDIVDKKNRKAFKDSVFSQYLETGKSAIEIYREISENDIEQGIIFDDVLDAIKEGSKKYLLGEEIDMLINNEKNIYDTTLKLDVNKKEIEIAQSESDYSKLAALESEATNFESNISSNRMRTFWIREKVIKRSGMDINPEYLQNVNENQNHDQESQEDIPQEKTSDGMGIETGKINVKQKNKIKGLGFFKNLFRKNQVTKTNMKEEFKTITALTQEMRNAEKSDGQDEKINTNKSKATDDALVQ